MKKLLALVVLLAMSCMFAACAGECEDKNKGESWCNGNTLNYCDGDEDPVEVDCTKESSFSIGTVVSGKGVCKEAKDILNISFNGKTLNGAKCAVDDIQVGSDK